MTETKRFKEWKKPVFDIEGWAYQKIEGNYPINPYHWRCQHPENLDLGAKTDVGCFVYMNAKHGIQIGDMTQVGSHCSIYSESTIYGKHSGVRRGRVVIGDDVMIGSHTVIMPGVRIANDAVIGACSFVNHDITDSGVYGGVPCVEIGERNDEFGHVDDKIVKCLRCNTFMSYKNYEVIHGKIVEFYGCKKCGVAFSIKDVG